MRAGDPSSTPWVEIQGLAVWIPGASEPWGWLP